MLSLLEQHLNALRKLPQTADTCGLIHTDVHFSNFFVHDAGITIFDFDDCAYNWFVFDLMIPIYYAMSGIPSSDMARREELATELFIHLIEGYQKENHLESMWFDQMATLLQFRDLQLYIWLVKNGWSLEDNRFAQFVCENIEQRRACVELDFRELYRSIVDA